MPASRLLTFVLLCGLTASAARATELVYVPVNPSFGGSPLNGPTLLGAAQAQNRFKEETPVSPLTKQTALDQFNNMLRSAILSRVAFALTADVVGPTGQLTPGTIETTDFSIAITALGGGILQIITTDKTTGQTTQFQVNQP
ncbi:curli assembly protein CsgF [Comamonas thiooxydans]|uniref:curli assembly protein CsgF n=1 Tax=Comamonas thiooxydans TaxID=363952 RepID=UPI0018A438E0|nr:curli assembly protein CsgF [Comamonas thiooxydans]QOQ83802.1 curli assembly protein CsgF [Comamonas thiooxydans]